MPEPEAFLSLDDLVTAVRHLADEPLGQLAEASRMKEELDERADALLGHFVDQARRAGHSWSEIGDALGVSKQAVQQRHAIPSTDRFTQRAKNAVRNASTMAVSLGHNYVGTEHLLLGICSEPKGIGGQILSDADLALDGVRDRVLERIGRGAAPPATEPVYTPRAKKALEATLAHALQLGHNYVGTEHLLLGLLAYGEGVGPDILAAGGVTLEHARAETIRRLSSLR